MNSVITRYLKLLSSKDKKLYSFIKTTFGIIPQKVIFYKTALIHKSASIHYSKGGNINNERLEFLGDAILDAIIADYLFSVFPGKSEGFLSKMRAKIVNREHLNGLAIKIGLGSFIVSHISNGQKKNIYGNAFEAIIGAIYLDKGFKKTKEIVIHRILKKHIDLKQLRITEINFKSKLLEWGQKTKQVIDFCCKNISNSGNNPYFECVAKVEGKEIEKGLGNTKKEAEQHAAENSLKKILDS